MYFFGMAPEGVIGKPACAIHRQPYATFVTRSWSDTPHIPYSDYQCCMLHTTARHKVPVQVSAESLDKSDYDIC